MDSGVCHSGRGDSSQVLYIHTGRTNTRGNGLNQHVPGNPGVSTDNDVAGLADYSEIGRCSLAGAKSCLAVHGIGIGAAPDAVGSK
jgi:hypothetical protein